MHSTNPALVERVDQRQVPTGLVPPVQLIHPIVDTHRVSTLQRDADYHFSFTASRGGSPAWYIVNGRGVPDDKLTSFARQLASSIGVEQAQKQLATLFSYLSELARRGLLWYTRPSASREPPGRRICARRLPTGRGPEGKSQCLSSARSAARPARHAVYPGPFLHVCHRLSDLRLPAPICQEGASDRHPSLLDKSIPLRGDCLSRSELKRQFLRWRKRGKYEHTHCL